MSKDKSVHPRFNYNDISPDSPKIIKNTKSLNLN